MDTPGNTDIAILKTQQGHHSGPLAAASGEELAILSPVASRTRSHRTKPQTQKAAGKRQRERAGAATKGTKEPKSFVEAPGRAEFPERTVRDYTGAVYPVRMYDIYQNGTEYVAVSPAYPSGSGSSSTSAEDAMQDLRSRIQAQIRDIIEDGWNSWELLEDNKLVPLPSELPSRWETSMRQCLEMVGYDILREYDTTVTVFPRGRLSQRSG